MAIIPVADETASIARYYGKTPVTLTRLRASHQFAPKGPVAEPVDATDLKTTTMSFFTVFSAF